MVNPVGPDRFSYTSTICEQIGRSIGIPIYLKKLDDDLLKHLSNQPHFRSAKSIPWHSSAILEDDTYSEVIVDIETTLQLLVAANNNDLRDKINRFHRRTADRPVRWKDIDRALYSDAKLIVNRFFLGKKAAHIDISTPDDYENMLLHPGLVVKDSLVIRKLCYIDRSPVAMLVLEALGSSSTMGLYCNLALYEAEKYLSEYVVIKALQEAQKRGFQYVNLGGSESLGLDRFKSKFMPVAKIPRPWLYYEYKQ
jgi:hypothetical protein